MGIATENLNFRSSWLATPTGNSSNILYYLTEERVDGENRIKAQRFDLQIDSRGGRSGDFSFVKKIVINEWLGEHPETPVDRPDQKFVWLDVTMTLENGLVIKGAIAYSGGNIGTIVDGLSCNSSEVPGLPTPTPTPTPMPDPVVYITCTDVLNGGGSSYEAVNVRLATNPSIMNSVVVNTGVYKIGNENDPRVKSMINQSVPGGVIQLPQNRDVISTPDQTYTLIRWDDEDTSTLDYWWIRSVFLVDQPNCEGITSVSPTPVTPIPTTTPYFEPLYGDLGSYYGLLLADLYPSNLNPPALMGYRGVHQVGNNALTFDTVPLSLEECIDKNTCGDVPLNQPIPVFSPVSGCVIQTPSTPSTVVIKYLSSCTDNPEPVIFISFSHIQDIDTREWIGGKRISKGQLIGYLCPVMPINTNDSCNLNGSPTHLAIGLSIQYFSGSMTTNITGGKYYATDIELVRVMPNLHDCFALPITHGSPIPAPFIVNTNC